MILVTGMSGTGKSTALTALCQQGYRVVDTDFGDWIEGIPRPDGDGVEPHWREDRCCPPTAGPGWDSGGRKPVPARRPEVPVSEALGVGSSRISWGSEGSPSWPVWVRFLASNAVGVGRSRTAMESGMPIPLPLIPRARCWSRLASHRSGLSKSFGAVAAGVGRSRPGDHLIWTVHSFL